MSSFSRLATVTASTKRRTTTGVIEAAAATSIASFACTPLDPVNAETIRRLNLTTALNVLETFCEGSLDIVSGDILVVSAIEYDVRFVEDYTWRSTRCLHLVIEAKK